MAKRKRNAGRTVLRLIRYVLALTFCFAAIMIAKELTQAHKEQSAFENLASIVEKADSTTRSAIRLTTELPQQAESHESQQLVESHKPSETAEAASPLVEEPVMLPEYAAIYEQNSDFFGWLSTCSYHTTDGRFVIVAKNVCASNNNLYER